MQGLQNHCTWSGVVLHVVWDGFELEDNLVQHYLQSLFEYVFPFATQLGTEWFFNVVANNYTRKTFSVLHRLHYIAQLKLIKKFGYLKSLLLILHMYLNSINTIFKSKGLRIQREI